MWNVSWVFCFGVWGFVGVCRVVLVNCVVDGDLGAGVICRRCFGVVCVVRWLRVLFTLGRMVFGICRGYRRVFFVFIFFFGNISFEYMVWLIVGNFFNVRGNIYEDRLDGNIFYLLDVCFWWREYGRVGFLFFLRFLYGKKI